MTFVYRLSLTTVVYSSGPVTPWIRNAVVAVVLVEAEIGPQPGRLDQDLGALVGEEVDVAGGVQVPLEGVDHRGVDVVLGGAGGVVRRGLLAVDGPPRVERPELAQLGGPLAGRVEHLPPEAEQLAGGVGVGEGQERQDVDLGVPEVVAVVATAGHALGGDPLLVGPGRRLGELEQVPADRLLGGVVALDARCRVRPRSRRATALLVGVELQPTPVLAAAVEGAVAPVGQLLGRDARDEWYETNLVMPDRLAGLGLGR